MVNVKFFKFIVCFMGLVTLCFMALPVLADAPSHRFVDVSYGSHFVLALRDDGTVWTWGALGCEKYGEGLNQRDYWVQTTPVQVPISDVVSISAGIGFSLALKNDGTVWSWGFNDYGELGDGTNTSTKKGDLTPVQVKNLTNVTQISAKGLHSLALRKDGTVWSWGYNYGGCLGDGTFDNRYTPVEVVGLSNITSIEGGNFAIKDDGTVWTWGLTLLNSNVKRDYLSKPSYDQVIHDLGKPTPYQIPGVSNVSSIDVDSGNHHVVFVKDDGTVWTWGFNEYGQLGDGAADMEDYAPYQSTPTQVKGINNVKTAVAGSANSLALDKNGMVWAWGGNYAMQLGFEDFGTYSTPKALDITNVTKISTGDMNTVFLKEDGSVWVIGGNNLGQRGNGSISDYIKTPAKVLGPDNENTIWPVQNNSYSSDHLINISPTPSPNNVWVGLGVLVLAIVIFAAGCLIYLTVLRKM